MADNYMIKELLCGLEVGVFLVKKAVFGVLELADISGKDVFYRGWCECGGF